MTTRKKATAGRKAGKKLKLRTETIRDLDSRSKGKDVRGGATGRTLLNQLTCLLCHTK